jgi:hypothetical protein
MAIPKNRPQKYRKVREVEAYLMDEENGKEVAFWSGGKFFDERKNGAVTTRQQVKIPTFDPNGEVVVLIAYAGDYVVKDKDGQHEIWPKEKFANEGFEPFYHRNTRSSSED